MSAGGLEVDKTYFRSLKRIYDLLVILETGMVTTAFDPGGTTGVHDMYWLSLDKARVPSCFLYVAEPRGGGMLIP